jgi:Ca2+:H+ antiporter
MSCQNGHAPTDDGERTPLLSSLRRRMTEVRREGESGRSGFQPGPFLRILWRSSCTASMAVNVLWPVVPVAFLLHFLPVRPLWTFAVCYVAVIPAANMLGFAGHEFSHKIRGKVGGIIIETVVGGVVEVILFMVLIARHKVQGGPGDGDGGGRGRHGKEANAEEGNLVPIIQAAILGSILTNLLLCLGLCFFFGGIRRMDRSMTFHADVSQVGTGLLLVAAFGLLIPSAYYSALKTEALPSFILASIPHDPFTEETLQDNVLNISRATSIALIAAFGLYVGYCASSQHSIFDEVIEVDEDAAHMKFTMIETVVALGISLACVTILLILLMERVEDVVGAGVPDQFLGLILLPLVEKSAEHLTAIGEAWGK